MPNEDEWYKAAYFDPAKSGGAGYWDYPTRSDAKPGRDFGLDNAANHYAEGLLEPKHFFSEAGAFARSLSASGTLDQAGNACEWTEALQPPFLRGIRGGAFDTEDAGLNIPTPNRSFTSISDVPNVGIRVAATVPGTTPQFPVQPAVDLAAGSAVTEFARRPWRDPLTGKPFFPLAWYSYQSDEADLDDIAREGGNLVLFVNTPCDLDNDQQLKENLPLLVKYLDHAQKCGVRVLVQTGGWYGAHMRGDAAEIARQRKFVAAIREHPALFGYQLYDEPEYKHGDSLGVTDRKGLDAFVGGMSALRDSLREWDPNPHRMISVVFNLVPLSSWTAYLPVVDSFHVDRYPLDKDQAYFGHRGDWGPLMMAWSMSHGAAALGEHPHLLNPAPCMQGVGSNHVEVGSLGIWRNPLYEETRYMAYSSLTVGSWGIFHWIRKFGMPASPTILENVTRLHRELRTLFPALEQSYETPPFSVRHNHENITRGFLTDSVADITTLALADADNYYLVVSDNSGTFNDVSLRLTGLDLGGTKSVAAAALNESWSRRLSYSEDEGVWMLDTHTMCFGDINIWVIPKRPAAEE